MSRTNSTDLEKKTSVSTNQDFLLDWATRIELEFLSFKADMRNVLLQKFDKVDFLPSEPKTTVQPNIVSNLDKLQSSINKLNKDFQALQKAMGNLANHSTCSVASNSKTTINKTVLHTNISSDVENLRLISDQMLRTLTTQSITKKSESNELDDIKYFLKLMLPSIMKIEKRVSEALLKRCASCDHGSANDMEEPSFTCPFSRIEICDSSYVQTESRSPSQQSQHESTSQKRRCTSRKMGT